MGAMRFVGFEDVAKAKGGVGIVHEGIDLEIVLETTEIDVGGANGGDEVVDDHHLGMEEAGLVEEDFYTSLHHIAQVGTRTHLHHSDVALPGEHDADIDT